MTISWVKRNSVFAGYWWRRRDSICLVSPYTNSYWFVPDYTLIGPWQCHILCWVSHCIGNLVEKCRQNPKPVGAGRTFIFICGGSYDFTDVETPLF